MQSCSTKITLKIKRDQNGTYGSTLPEHPENTNQNAVDLSSSDEAHDFNEENHSNGNAQNQLVIYDPSENGRGQIEPVPDHTDLQLVPLPKKSIPYDPAKPFLGDFIVQCAECFKWRIMPSKEKYEEIREHILEKPFYCCTAREWRPDISCEDPGDIMQDGSRIWAIDKPNIARPPPGWQRLLRIRPEGSTKFADVYYVAPTGKRFRSMNDVQKYLLEHPEYIEAGVKLSQFSFQTPKPSNENYVRKRPARSALPENNGTTGPLQPSLVDPISYAAPDENIHIQLDGSGFSMSPSSEPTNKPNKRAKKEANESPSDNVACDDQQVVKMNEPFQPVQVEELSQPISGAVDLY